MRTNKLRTLGGVFGLAILGLAPVTAKAETLADALKKEKKIKMVGRKQNQCKKRRKAIEVERT